VRLTLDALKILDRGFVEEKAVSLVERVDLATGRNLDVGVREDELAETLRKSRVRDREKGDWSSAALTVSKVKPFTPFPVEMTRLVDEPYIQ
jgi:hypothetical protein